MHFGSIHCVIYLFFVGSHFHVFWPQIRGPKPRKELEIQLPRRNFDTLDLPKELILTEKGAHKGGHSGILGDAGGPGLAANPE